MDDASICYCARVLFFRARIREMRNSWGIFGVHSVFFIRTSDFGAEAERSYIFLRFETENVLKMFLNYMVFTTYISVNQCGRNQETYQSALPAKIWYQEMCVTIVNVIQNMP